MDADLTDVTGGWRWTHPDPSATVAARAEEWMRHPALARVVRALAGPDVSDLPYEAARTVLVSWSAVTLDRRHGRERHETVPEELPPGVIAVVLPAARALGLLATPGPSLAAYDDLVVLAGTAVGNEVRLGHATGLLDDGLLAGRVTVVGSDLALSASENGDAVEQGAPPEALASEMAHTRWAAFTPAFYQGPVPVLLLVPPRTDGSRPDSLDAYRKAVANDPDAVNRLVLTSSVYVPYTFFSLAPHVRPGDRLEVVGTPATAATYTTGSARRLLQEINSALRGLPHEHV